ncbi:MAG: tryptophan synthase subunit alpha [Chloroflexi bacterium]|nr:MAG: tryptophan synthase subunit alpha [Chloroflexota bacterium]MCQ3937910.1 tryptophan synthase subunit alpha [Chloroflexota bacterium]MDL1943849.1 tryptophan synthase subunit alpha [Chloroflexi bacterium CFX2]
MNRIENAFKNKPIFMPYFPLGYPDLDTSIDVIEALAKNGADLIEVGLSFSDPLADGPVIQRATQIALEKGITIKKSLEAVKKLRQRGVDIPLILMGYYNPMLAYGLEKFARDAVEAGADGFIVPDLPMEELDEFESALGKLGDRVDGGGVPPSYRDHPLIPMLAPTTPPERMEKIARNARGFIYLVSVTGVTGERTSISGGLGDLIHSVREHTSAPVCVGFGISTPEQARQVGALADGVIVGSACVKTIGGSETPVETAREFARSFRNALRESAD